MKYFSVFVLLLVSVVSANAFSSAPPDGHAANPPAFNNCTACHSSFTLNSGDGSFLFTDIPEDGYEPGETYQVSLSISDPGQSRWGFEFTAQQSDNSMAGEILLTEPNRTQLSTQSGITYVKQTFNGTNGGETSSSWTFSWTAPHAGSGPVTFYAVGNAGNNDFISTGDYIYAIDATINEIVTDDPIIVLSVTEYDFGPILVDDSRFWDLHVSNDGTGDLVLSSATTGGSLFVVEDIGSMTIAAGESMVIQMSFNPVAEGMVEDSLIIESNDPENGRVVVMLSGTGVLPQAPEAFDLVSPMDEHVITGESQAFIWNATMDPDPGADLVSYMFQWSMDESFSSYREVSTGTDSMYVLDSDSLDTEVDYFWRVLALDPNTDGTFSSQTWSFSLESENSVDDIVTGIPQEFGITKAYPNPFNSTVNVRLAVPQLATVQVSIYDIMGREVVNLNQGVLTPGTHELVWQASGSAGIYFVRATTNTGQSAIQKLMFVK